MIKIRIRRLIQVFQFGWKDAKDIHQMNNKKSRIAIFIDIIYCFVKFYVSGFQYKKNKLWELTKENKKNLAKQLGVESKYKDEWYYKYYKNWEFINRYSGVRWETSQTRRNKRNRAYSVFYNFGKNCWTQNDVYFLFEHYSVGLLSVGNNCLFARGCNIDITGDLEIGNNVGILEGAKILTHAHDSYHFMAENDLIPFSNRAYKTNLKIGNNVTICAHAIIMPGVREIGDNSIISAGSIVNRPVPANVVVSGNPAQVVRKIPVGVKIRKHEE